MSLKERDEQGKTCIFSDTSPELAFRVLDQGDTIVENETWICASE